MKARNAYGQFINDNCNHLKPLSEKQVEGIIRTYPEKTAMMLKTKTICTCCGHEFENMPGKTITCPNCHKKLEVKFTHHRYNRISAYYYTLLDIYKGIEVIRHFLVTKYLYKKDSKPEYNINEVAQVWIDGKNKPKIAARPVTPFSFDRWLLQYDMELRQRYYHNYYSSDRYLIGGYPISGGKITPILKKRGLSVKTINSAHTAQEDIIENVYYNSFAEFLLKVGQIKMLEYIINHESIKNYKYERQVKICNRHKYIIEDASLWHDYIELLDENNYDIHSPHYICPENLKLSHDWILKINLKRIKKEEEEKLREQIKQDKKAEKEYEKRIKNFKNMDITDGNIHIKVLPTVKDVAEEGVSMHHCIFRCKYYKKKDTLLMSARNNDGERVETIEYDLKKMIVVQSRGVCNSQTNMHDQIINLINSNKSNIIKFKNHSLRHKKTV